MTSPTPPTAALIDALRAARTAAAVADLSWLAHIDVTGTHRGRFLHNMTTCQVKALEPGQGNFGLVVDDGGKLVAAFHLDADTDSLRVELDTAVRDDTLAQLQRYLIADDVRFTLRDDLRVLTVVGPAAAALVGGIVTGVELPDARYAWAEATVRGVPVRIRRDPMRVGLPGVDVTALASDAPGVLEALRSAGAIALDAAAWELLRVEAGVPRVGLDMGRANVPLESERLAETIDWDKGCYIGQEVIAMMHYRGRPNRHLRALRLPDDGPAPAQGSAVLTDSGKEVGVVGTVVISPAAGGRVALAVLKRRHADAGTTLALPAGARAEVLALPLAPGE